MPASAHHEQESGRPSEAIAKAGAPNVCDPAERDDLIECSMVQVDDPEGAEQMRLDPQAQTYQITFSMITAGMPEPLTPQSGVVPTCLKPLRS